MDRFRFHSAELQQTLAGLYSAAGLPHDLGSDGALSCEEAFADRAEALRSAVRSQRFAAWQTRCVLDDPENDGGEYREAAQSYLDERAIPYEIEEHNGEIWLLLPEDEALPDSLWEAVYGSVTTLVHTRPLCCFCRAEIVGDTFGEVSIRRPDGGFRSVLYAHLDCLRRQVHPEALHIIETTD